MQTQNLYTMERLKLFSILLINILFLGQLHAQSSAPTSPTNVYHQEWAVQEISELKIDNRYGDIYILNSQAPTISIDVKIDVQAANEKIEQQILNQIGITFNKSGNQARAVTNIDGSLNGQKTLNIHYTVHVPADKKLEIINHYGDTHLQKLTAGSAFYISYGNLNADTLLTAPTESTKIELEYGQLIINEASNLNLNVAYSPVSINSIKNLTITSKYSTVKISEAGQLNIKAQSDHYEIGKVYGMNAHGDHSRFSISNLLNSLKAETNYGNLRVLKIAPSFSSIAIQNNYASIDLNANGIASSINASCQECDIRMPENRFKGARSTEDRTVKINGHFGENVAGNITINSIFGTISIQE